MKQETLEKCISMIQSPDPEMRQLGKATFVAQHPTLTDLFVLDMRCRPIPELEDARIYRRPWSDWMWSEPDHVKIINEIRGEIWGYGLGNSR